MQSRKVTRRSPKPANVFNVDIATIDSQNVGPSWGAEISRKALLGLFWFIIVLLIYLTFALEIRMALAAILAVIHDVFITVGLYAATGLKVTPAAVIGFLTILGYSLYDTVVVFDKVRENVSAIRRKGADEYQKSVNLALNQTLIRSINTSVVAVIPIASILIIVAIFLKAETLKDISLALVIGQSVGTYSSILIAAPLLVKLSARRSSKKADTEFADLFSARARESKARAVKSSAAITLPVWTIAPLSRADSADLFRSLFDRTELWENIFVDKPVPESLEQFTSLVHLATTNQSSESQYWVIRTSDTRGISGLVKLNLETVHESAEMAIEAPGIDDPSSVASFCSELSNYLTEKGFTRFSIRVSNLPSALELLSGLPLVKEGQLVGARKTRTGLCDVLIFRLVR